VDLEHLIDLCRCFEGEGLAFWIDGGCGVDALLGEQTRPHSDLDLAIKLDDLPAFQRVLQTQAYFRIRRVGNADWNWVFQDPAGRSVDLHGFVLDGYGNGVLGDAAEGAMYLVGALYGAGMLGGIEVRCVAAPFVLKFRNGFEPRSVDRHDVAALCARFGLARPSRFQLDDRS
jgi:lincosamide nucleotidyltransferase A/C/D/E